MYPCKHFKSYKSKQTVYEYSGLTPCFPPASNLSKLCPKEQTQVAPNFYAMVCNKVAS